jgi:hypothetical protein
MPSKPFKRASQKNDWARRRRPRYKAPRHKAPAPSIHSVFARDCSNQIFAAQHCHSTFEAAANGGPQPMEILMRALPISQTLDLLAIAAAFALMTTVVVSAW